MLLKKSHLLQLSKAQLVKRTQCTLQARINQQMKSLTELEVLRATLRIEVKQRVNPLMIRPHVSLILMIQKEDAELFNEQLIFEKIGKYFFTNDIRTTFFNYLCFIILYIKV
jgi:hypothetical protein